jgi:diguanylate cyclase (GGDEF)-like protein
MTDLINKWRFYGLGEAEYKRSLKSIFAKNIHSLRKINAAVAAILTSFLFVPLFIDKNLTTTLFFIGTSVIAVLLYIFIRLKYHRTNKEKTVKQNLVYILICLYYINVVSFGIYLDVWSHPGNTAGAFLAILICALLLFNIPPLFHYCLTICSIVTFIIIVCIVKNPLEKCVDIPYVLLAGTISLILNWHVIMTRLALASFADKMEEERNNYFDQSTIDELTQLKNRRDFLNTFQRALTSYRQMDNFLCIAILDIDYFKNYNDHYGHPKGDECLRNVGKALRDLQNNMNIYAARIGGEEFALVWFEKDASNAQNVAEMINEMIRCLNIPHEKSHAAPYVTASIGIHVIPCGASEDIDFLYSLADEALYSAKNSGRNCAVIHLYGQLREKSLRETA